MVAERFVY